MTISNSILNRVASSSSKHLRKYESLIKRVPSSRLTECLNKTLSSAADYSVYIAIAAASILYYLAFHGPANLHDIAHYIVAGVAMVRDHANLVYPYSSMDPEGSSAYSYFQANSHLVSVHKSYPSKLYSALFSLDFAATGRMHFHTAHLIAMACITGSNILLYSIARKLIEPHARLLFLTGIMFLPLMSSVLYPSNDAVGYFTAVLVLWACLSPAISPLLIGLIIGTSAQLRSQMIFFIIFAPFLLYVIDDRRSRIGSAAGVAIAGLIAYITIGAATSYYFDLPKSDGEGGINFYIKFFLQSFYGPDNLPIIFKQFTTNLLNLGHEGYLSIYLYIGILALFSRKCVLARALATTGFLVVSVPLVIYSLDRYSAPHPRYYTGAIPFFALAWFLILKNQTKKISLIVGFATALFVTVTWHKSFQSMYQNVTSIEVIKNRLTFLDFADAGITLDGAFQADSLLLTNHALPSGLSNLKNFIPCPDYNEFIEGDNKEIDGITFLYSEKGVNSFFKPASWMQNGSLPEIIEDKQGTRFEKIAHYTSYLRNGNGETEDTVYFLVYKNMAATNHSANSQGQRVYSVAYHPDLTHLVTSSPDLSDLTPWHPRESENERGAGQTVGPGPDNRNVLTQPFYTNGNSEFLVTAIARSATGRASRGRLQVNWLDAQGSLLKADIGVFTTSENDQQYRRFMIAPPGATSGWVYVTPHGEKDIIHFTSMGVYSHGPGH